MPRRPIHKPSPFWRRLEEALGKHPAYQPFNANRVARKLYMSQGSVHRWFTGAGLPELDTAIRLANDAGVCLDWLLRGSKPKYPISRDPLLTRLMEIAEELHEDGRKALLRSAEGELELLRREEREHQESVKHAS